MNKNKIKDTKKSPATNVVYLKNVRNIKEKNVKKSVKKTKWSKSLCSKSLKCADKFLLSLCSDKDDDDTGMFEFFLRTCIIREYLMKRQFSNILPPLESNSFSSSVEDKIYYQYKSAFDPDWIRDVIYKNQKSNSTNKANIYGLYVNNRGLMLSDETHPEFFKIWNQIYYSNKEKFLDDLESFMVEMAYDFFVPEELGEDLELKEDITKFIKTL